MKVRFLLAGRGLKRKSGFDSHLHRNVMSGWTVGYLKISVVRRRGGMKKHFKISLGGRNLALFFISTISNSLLTLSIFEHRFQFSYYFSYENMEKARAEFEASQKTA